MTSDIREPSNPDGHAPRASKPSSRPEEGMPPLGGAGPWWADLGAIGGLVVAALGLAAIVLLLLGMPGFPQGSWTDYYGLAKVVAIGLVAGGATLFSRRRGKPAPPPSGETGEAPDNAR